jgi:hypothetical protein
VPKHAVGTREEWQTALLDQLASGRGEEFRAVRPDEYENGNGRG